MQLTPARWSAYAGSMITESRVKALVDHFATEQGLTNYTVSFNNHKRTLGSCQFHVPVYEKGQFNPFKSHIELKFSRHWMEHAPLEEVLDTILHELAHGLAGPRADHGHEWKRIAHRLGCKPKHATDYKMPDEVKEKTHKWLGICINGHKTYRHRLTAKAKNVSCGRCSSRYDPKYKYAWKELR